MHTRLLAVLFVSVALQVSADVVTAEYDIRMDARAIALIAVDDALDIDLTLHAPVQPGDPPVGGTDTTKRLRYTAVAPEGTPCRIRASYLSGTLPSGTAVSVAVSGAVPAGCGIPAPTAVTIGSGTPVIDSIDGCATGTAPGSGPLLTYTLVVTDTAQLAVDPGTPVTVAYTLSSP